MRISAAFLALAVLGTLVSAAATPPEKQVFTRHWTTRDQQTGRYQYVPFDVAPGTTSVTVSYRYNRAAGNNVIDFGLFEPGPLALGSPAFRGWSGGARDTVTIAMDGATPGYWPGPLPAGRWHAILGLYEVADTGVDVEIAVETSTAPAVQQSPTLPQRAKEAVRPGPAWYAGALHTHTIHSDGALTSQQLADKAVAEKLDFLAITDHNNTTHQLDPIHAPGLLIITGEEVTTPGGHFGVLGLEGQRTYVDFRMPSRSPDIGPVMTAARARGALIAINHPSDDCLACSWTHSVPPEVSAIEIANGEPVARQLAMTLWDALLREGRRLTALGESDYHRGPTPLGTPSVRVWAQELSRPAILASIGSGRVVVMANGSMPPPELTVRAGRVQGRVGDALRVKPGEPLQVSVEAVAADYKGGRVELYWNGEQVASATMPDTARVEFERFATTAGYLRIHLLGAGGQPLAITNPVFIEIAA